MASNLLRQASSIPSSRRLKWLRGELNKTHPGLGDKFVSKMRELRTKGWSPDQSAFDALRLVLMNRVATGLEDRVPALSGLGKADPANITAAFCGITGIATAGGAIASSFSNPTGSAAVGTAGSQAMQAAGCNQGALEAQARIAEANAQAAAANAAMAAGSGSGGSDKTLTYVAVGGGVLLVSLLGVFALRK
jgi:hypothetical protein